MTVMCNQEFPERYRSDDHGKRGVRKHKRLDWGCKRWKIRDLQISIKVPLSDDYTMEIVLIGDNHERRGGVTGCDR